MFSMTKYQFSDYLLLLTWDAWILSLIFSRGYLRIPQVFATSDHDIYFREKLAEDRVLIFSILKKKRKAPLSLTSLYVSRLCWLSLYDSVILIVMVNFMCQLGWATVHRYLVKYHSGCFYEGVFGWDLHINQWTLSKVYCPL